MLKRFKTEKYITIEIRQGARVLQIVHVNVQRREGAGVHTYIFTPKGKKLPDHLAVTTKVYDDFGWDKKMVHKTHALTNPR